MAKRQVKQKKSIFRHKRVKLILAVILVIGGVFFAVQGVYSKDNQVNATAPNYGEVEKTMKEKGLDVALVEKVVLNATNGTDKAVAGSALTYWAEVTGLDSSGNVVVKKITDVTVLQNGAASEDIKFLTGNTIAILDKAIQEQTLDIKVSYCGLTNTYHYGIVHQTISTDNFALLVNRYTGISENYEPSSLAKSSWIHYTNGTASTSSNLDARVNTALEAMFTAAKADGITLWACSGYRSYDSQAILYERANASLGAGQQDTAPPGHSEHQTGFTMDITWPSVGGGLTQSMENTAEYKWLMENSYKYGFVLRYPKGMTDITGYLYEPWHFRYIGVDLATLYHNSGISTLDEFLSIPR